MPPRKLQRHDQFFQRMLDKPGTAGALLRERLPAEVVRLLVDEPPELIPGTFVSPRLRAYRTDRLYRTRTLTGRPVLIFALLEHKSTPDPRIDLQLLGYQYQALDHWNRTEGQGPDGRPLPLPAIITMVIYNGTEEWTVPLSLAEGTRAGPKLRPHILDFRYSLVDLRRIPEENLSRERDLRVGLLILKHGREARKDRSRLLLLIRAADALGDDDLVTLIYYLVGDPDGPDAVTVRATLNEILPEKGDRIMSTAGELWKAEGFNQGLLQGEARGKTEGKAEMLLRLLLRRFRSVPTHVEDKVRAARSDQLDDWSERFVDAQTLADIFGPEAPH